MKYIVQIEVEAPENTDAANFPPETWAVEIVGNWLRSTEMAYQTLILDVMAGKDMPEEMTEESKQAYIRDIQARINNLNKSRETISAQPIPAVIKASVQSYLEAAIQICENDAKQWVNLGNSSLGGRCDGLQAHGSECCAKKIRALQNDVLAGVVPNLKKYFAIT
jgi:predicted alpha/beta-hydrolase family hydrolase